VPQSLASLLVHLVFSTKDREAFLHDELRDALHAYIGGIAPADLVKEIKIGSSKWIKERDKRLSAFHWQGGYGMFSISPSHREALERYIGNQAEHHRVITFQEEYRRLLTRYGVEWDEQYVWD